MAVVAAVRRPYDILRMTGWLCRLVLLGALGSGAAAAAERIALTLPSGQDIEFPRYPGSGKSTVLWIPSERGLRGKIAVHAARLAQKGHEVWLPDLHEAYFLTQDADSIGQIPIDDLVAMIEAAAGRSDAPVLLVSSLRGAQLALVAAREWQLRHPGETQLKGVFLVQPHLYRSRPEAGQAARYLPITAATNLPVYLLETQYSTQSPHLNTLAGQLGRGGSQVYTQLLGNVYGGFFARDDGDLNAASVAASRDYAATLDRALRLLISTATPDHAASAAGDTRQLGGSAGLQTGLQALAHPLEAPTIRLPRFPGGEETILPRPGQPALINFWVSWCGPCVEEIPSLHRLQWEMEGQAFDIVTVNIGENRELISEFVEQVPMELPVLMDSDGETARRWNIYVYPSSYLVDAEGRIRYAYLGALEWDAPENVRLMRQFAGQN